MGLLRNRLLRRFSPFARVADMALVASMGLRFAKRKGWIGTDNPVTEMSLSGSSNGSRVGLTELAMGGAALVRLLRRKR